ncbi:MAG TPA: hypothetical protein VIN10_14440 [Bacteroidales bacterium]
MKKVSIVVLLTLLGFTINAQHVFDKGSLMFNAGIGAPYNYGFIPTINFSGDYGVIPTGDVGVVSFGGLAEIQFADYDWYYYYGAYSGSQVKPIFYLGPRASWHLLVFESSEFDVYAGVGFGIKFYGNYNYNSSKNDVEYDPKVGGYGEGFVGGRWMFKDNLGLFAELGGGAGSVFRFGLTFATGNK